METKHTPGPWTFEICTGHEKDESWPFFIEAEQCTVAGVSGIGNQADANARLIAASPELLAACQNSLDSLCGDGGEDRVEVAKEYLRAAIAKAVK